MSVFVGKNLIHSTDVSSQTVEKTVKLNLDSLELTFNHILIIKKEKNETPTKTIQPPTKTSARPPLKPTPSTPKPPPPQPTPPRQSPDRGAPLPNKGDPPGLSFK